MAVIMAPPLEVARKDGATRESVKSGAVSRDIDEKKELHQAMLAEERDLVERVLKGSKDEFKVLVDRYQHRVLAVAIGLVGNRDDAEDLVQQAFLKAYSNLQSFRGQSSFYTWLYRILVNLSIDLSRKAYRRSELQVEESVSLEAVALKAGTDPEVYMGHIASPEESFARGEMREAFRQALDELTPEHRSVLVLREVEGLSYAEISETVGCTKGTVMSRLHHARKKMQRKLKELLALEGAAAEGRSAGM